MFAHIQFTSGRVNETTPVSATYTLVSCQLNALGKDHTQREKKKKLHLIRVRRR